MSETDLEKQVEIENSRKSIKTKKHPKLKDTLSSFHSKSIKESTDLHCDKNLPRRQESQSSLGQKSKTTESIENSARLQEARENFHQKQVIKSHSIDQAQIQQKRMKYALRTPLESKNDNFNEFEGISSNICEGFLYIQSKSLWMFPNHLWKKRYFRLQNDVLYFTKNKGDLIFEDMTPAIEIEADTGIYPEESAKGKFFIRICKGKQTFTLCSDTEEDRNRWMACLLTVITQKYVVNFKAGFYKSVRLNYKPKPQGRPRYSSLIPKRLSDESLNTRFSRVDEDESLVMNKAESLFNIPPPSEFGCLSKERADTFVSMQALV